MESLRAAAQVAAPLQYSLSEGNKESRGGRGEARAQCPPSARGGGGAKASFSPAPPRTSGCTLTIELIVDHLLQVAQAPQDGLAVGARAGPGKPAARPAVGAAHELCPPPSAVLQPAVGREQHDAHEDQNVHGQQSLDPPSHRHGRRASPGARPAAWGPRATSARRALSLQHRRARPASPCARAAPGCGSRRASPAEGAAGSGAPGAPGCTRSCPPRDRRAGAQ